MRLQQSLAAIALMAAVAAHAEGVSSPESSGCAGTLSAVAPSSVVQTPDYVTAADAAEESEQAWRVDAWHEYQRSVVAGLAQSADRRDWAMASLIPDFEYVFSTPKARDNSALLRRALSAAGDDRVVLWLAASQREDVATRDAALTTLRAVEPENAAVWLADLNTATEKKDQSGIDSALRRLADANRFDTYATRLMIAATDAYRRFPASAELRAGTGDDGSTPSPEMTATMGGFALAGMHGMPAFQSLINACRVDAAKGLNLVRRDDCGATGRLLMTHSDTLVASRIGMSVLRVSQTYAEDDLHAARNADWTYDQYLTLMMSDESDAGFAKVSRFYDDWVATGSEVEAMRLAVVRAGLSATPPDDWKDNKSVFSEERLRTDQVSLDRAATQ